MRGQFSLPPIKVSERLSKRAAVTAETLANTPSHNHPKELVPAEGIATTSPDNLDHMLSYQCNEMGLCVYTTPRGEATDSFIVQVFAIKKKPHSEKP